MKKILGISLCALFAVSAANANIASTEWVQEQIGGIDTQAIATNTANITALDGRVTQNTTNIGTNTQSITALDGRVTQNETDIDSLQATAQGLGALATKDAVTNAEITDNTIKNADIATDAAIATTKIAFSTQQTAALNSGITSESVNKIDDNADAISENAGAIAINKTNIQSNSDNIVALQSRTENLKALAYKDKVAAGDINPGAIVDADISDSARIATGKIAFSDAEKAALGSTITVAKVGQIETNKTNITSLQTTVSEHNEALKPSSECMNNADGCTLVYRNNAYSWEKITREAQ